VVAVGSLLLLLLPAPSRLPADAYPLRPAVFRTRRPTRPFAPRSGRRLPHQVAAILNSFLQTTHTQIIETYFVEMHHAKLVLLSRLPLAPLLAARLFLVNPRVLAFRRDALLHPPLEAVDAAAPLRPRGEETGAVRGLREQSFAGERLRPRPIFLLKQVQQRGGVFVMGVDTDNGRLLSVTQQCT
jgi:hypothetical protein